MSGAIARAIPKLVLVKDSNPAHWQMLVATTIGTPCRSLTLLSARGYVDVWKVKKEFPGN
jgi:hypothetical protein